jgi:hypothetical protein
VELAQDFRCGALGWAVVAPLVLAGQMRGPASPPGGVPNGTVPPYRPPVLALVQPEPGGSVADDRPIVLFRFAPGEPNDPVDARSFAVAVNAIDRSAAFQVTATDAWGAMADTTATVALGPHHITARICSARGACAFTTASVTVGRAMPAPPVAGGAAVDSATSSAASRRRRVLDVILDALQKLLRP